MKRRPAIFPRVGFGFDAHDFGRTGTLVLGGVRIPGAPQLKGHSDADVLLHAVIDSILGAAGLGDIGDHFPDSSPKFKGISSRRLVTDTLKQAAQIGFSVYQTDITLVADRPRLGAYKVKIRESLAQILRISVEYVNIKAKTSEGTRVLSSSGGIAAWAATTLIPTQNN